MRSGRSCWTWTPIKLLDLSREEFALYRKGFGVDVRIATLDTDGLLCMWQRKTSLD